jgi:dihydroorotate dehydrogenase electron transfer subunit
VRTSRRAAISKQGKNKISVQTASVLSNEAVCREHYRLTIALHAFPGAGAGQFLHLSPAIARPPAYHTSDRCSRGPSAEWISDCDAPLLRRAFSIAGLRRNGDGASADVIYRVVGTATRWMQSLAVGDRLSVLGPLGNRFPISEAKPVAWLVSGGVGLPPMLWLAEALHAAGRRAVAFCGARTTDSLALNVGSETPPARDARCATLSCSEFARSDVGVVISTDDGSLGFHGHIGTAVTAYHELNPVEPDDLVVYTCGPEPMMRFIAEYCIERNIECHVCMERAMACGTGLCQSCVVPVRDDNDSEGWRYRLCCTDGPIFDASAIIWDAP